MNNCFNRGCTHTQIEPLDLYLGCEVCVNKFNNKMIKLSSPDNKDTVFKYLSDNQVKRIATEISNLYKVKFNLHKDLNAYLQNKYGVRLADQIYGRLKSKKVFELYNLKWKWKSIHVEKPEKKKVFSKTYPAHLQKLMVTDEEVCALATNIAQKFKVKIKTKKQMIKYLEKRYKIHLSHGLYALAISKETFKKNNLEYEWKIKQREPKKFSKIHLNRVFFNDFSDEEIKNLATIMSETYRVKYHSHKEMLKALKISSKKKISMTMLERLKDDKIFKKYNLKWKYKNE